MEGIRRDARMGWFYFSPLIAGINAPPFCGAKSVDLPFPSKMAISDFSRHYMRIEEWVKKETYER